MENQPTKIHKIIENTSFPIFVVVFLSIFILVGCSTKNKNINESSQTQRQTTQEIENINADLAEKSAEIKKEGTAIEETENISQIAESGAEKEAEELEKIEEENAKKLKEQGEANRKLKEELKKQTEDEEKAEEDEKKTRQNRANKASSQLTNASKEISEEMDDLTEEMSDLNKKIEDVYNQPVAMAFIDGQVAPLKSQLKSLQDKFNSLIQLNSKIASIFNALNSYSNYGAPLSSSDISFLSSLGISF